MSVSKLPVEFVGAEGNRLAATAYLPASGGRQVPPPILLMHGGGQTRHSWDAAANMFAGRGNLAITVDARGHGDSAWVDSQNYTFSDFSSDLRRIAQQIGLRFTDQLKPPVLVGASMGGISAMLAQSAENELRSSALFSAIVLVDITPRMQESGVDRILGFMSQDMHQGFDDVQDAAETIATYLPGRARPRSLNGLRKNLRQREDGRWYWHWDPAFVDGPSNIMTGEVASVASLMEAASQISVPTLLVRGGKSELVSPEAAREFLELVPHAEFVDVSGAGHMVAGDRNDVFAMAVLEFLAQQELVGA